MGASSALLVMIWIFFFFNIFKKCTELWNSWIWGYLEG